MNKNDVFDLAKLLPAEFHWGERLQTHHLKEILNNYDKEISAGTPAARWAERGEKDPHGNRYNCERSELAGGRMTDDELANAIYMMLAAPGYITIQTAAKERIRWLSRKLEELKSKGEK